MLSGTPDDPSLLLLVLTICTFIRAVKDVGVSDVRSDDEDDGEDDADDDKED